MLDISFTLVKLELTQLELCITQYEICLNPSSCYFDLVHTEDQTEMCCCYMTMVKAHDNEGTL